jgi:hypothetical protein
MVGAGARSLRNHWEASELRTVGGCVAPGADELSRTNHSKA